MLGQIEPLERFLDSVAFETVGTIVVVLIVVAILAGIGRRAYRYWSLRSLAGGQGWRWLGRSTDFARLVFGAFPEIVASAKRSARRNAMRTSSRTGSRSALTREAAGLAIDLSGLGSGTRVNGRGRYVSVAASQVGEANVGEAHVSARSRGVRVGRDVGHGRSSRTSSAHCSAAVAALPAALPELRLAPRTLLGRLFGRGGNDLPEEITRRFEVDDLSPEARSALVDGGAYRALFDHGVKVHGLTIAQGHIAVMTRRRLTRRRAQALVQVLEQLVQQMPNSAWSDTPGTVRLQAPVTE